MFQLDPQVMRTEVDYRHSQLTVAGPHARHYLRRLLRKRG
jgi:hypothetical protein